MFGGWSRRLAVALVVLSFFTLTLPQGAASSAPVVPMGMDTASVSELRSLGAPPGYASYWAGQWMATSGWGGLDNALQTAKAAGVTPLLYWYYWGDSISPTCVEQGCAGLSKAQWDSMTQTLVAHVNAQLAGAPSVIVLENEFNKNGIDSASYAPTFDSYLAAKVATLHGASGARVVLGFGGWGESNWGLFPKAIAASDALGFQTMRASTKDTEASYRGAPDRIGQLITAAQNAGGKGAFLYDLALSSYPDSYWANVQAQTLADIISREPSFQAAGLQGIVYRSLQDSPGMSPANYYGYAEQHWGLRDSSDVAKPAWAVWSGAYASTLPGSFEAESMAHTTGGPVSDAGASGGVLWNLWSNGDAHQIVSTATGGTFRVTILARGTPAAGVDAHMELRLNGATIAGWDVPQGAILPYAANVTFPAGQSTLAVAFTNDLLTSTEDRNLLVDVVRVAADQGPVASMTASTAGMTASFDGSASRDPDGDALTYAWAFGDGATATGATASHAYARSGSYHVTLTVSDGQVSASASRDISVDVPPVARMSLSGANLSWMADGSASSDTPGDTLTYAWTWGDGASSAGVTSTHAYAASGNYTVTLTVSDGTLSSSTSAAVAAVKPDQPPVARMSLSGSNLSWSASAAASSDPDGDPLTYAWSWGDGATATGVTATHAYAAAGSYTVTLTVSDGKLSSSTSQVASATAPPPPAPTPAPLPPFSATFSPYGGNNWWVQTLVNASQPVAGLCASVNGGACQKLAPQSWGAWAASFYVPTNATIRFTATNASGASVASGTYLWPSAARVLAAQFQPYGGNNWWVQTRVLNATWPVASVCASVNGGACQKLTLHSWGAWAASFYVATSQRVTFTATSTTGQSVTSAAYSWPVA